MVKMIREFKPAEEITRESLALSAGLRGYTQQEILLLHLDEQWLTTTSPRTPLPELNRLRNQATASQLEQARNVATVEKILDDNGRQIEITGQRRHFFFGDHIPETISDSPLADMTIQGVVVGEIDFAERDLDLSTSIGKVLIHYLDVVIDRETREPVVEMQVDITTVRSYVDRLPTPDELVLIEQQSQ